MYKGGIYMSSERKEQIKCPKCGKNNDFTIWNSLNGDLNPEEKFKDTKIDDVFFLVSNGKYRLEFIGESCFGVEFTKEIYDDIKNIYIERLNSLGDNEKIIDMDWAVDFLKNN